jgi:hypothetical protein
MLTATSNTAMVHADDADAQHSRYHTIRSVPTGLEDVATDLAADLALARDGT